MAARFFRPERETPPGHTGQVASPLSHLQRPFNLTPPCANWLEQHTYTRFGWIFHMLWIGHALSLLGERGTPSPCHASFPLASLYWVLGLTSPPPQLWPAVEPLNPEEKHGISFDKSESKRTREDGFTFLGYASHTFIYSQSLCLWGWNLLYNTVQALLLRKSMKKKGQTKCVWVREHECIFPIIIPSWSQKSVGLHIETCVSVWSSNPCPALGARKMNFFFGCKPKFHRVTLVS